MWKNFMDLNNIADSEILYRMVKKSDPNGFINGKPTAALFMDKSGASVDRDGGRSEEEIIENFKWRFRKKDDYKTSVKISAQQCRNSDTFPTRLEIIKIHIMQKYGIRKMSG